MYSAFLLTAMTGIAAVATPTDMPAKPRAVVVSAQVAALSPDYVTLLWRFDLTGRWHLYGPFVNDSGFAQEMERRVFEVDVPKSERIQVEKRSWWQKVKGGVTHFFRSFL